MSERATLNEAILALRASRGDPSEAEQTLERIGATLERPSPARIAARLARYPRLASAAAVGLGLLLATSSYAAFFGLPASWTTWFSAASRSEAPSAVREPRAVPAAKVSAKPATHATQSAIDAPTTARESLSAPDLTRAPPAAASEATATMSVRRPRRVRAGLREPAPAVAPAASARAPIEPGQLYREAHRLHFVSRDYAAALDAWELYLRVAGDAALVVEARYNRALCLVRLGDHGAARSALMPIARGEDGAYRQREARTLLRLLR